MQLASTAPSLPPQFITGCSPAASLSQALTGRLTGLYLDEYQSEPTRGTRGQSDSANFAALFERPLIPGEKLRQASGSDIDPAYRSRPAHVPGRVRRVRPEGRKL